MLPADVIQLKLCQNSRCMKTESCPGVADAIPHMGGVPGG